MGQKVNPISLRLEQTNRHFDSCWFNDYNYTNLLNRDIKIQSYINLILKQIKYSSARFFIQHLPNKIKINVFFLNPKSFRKSTSKAFQLKEFPNSLQRKDGTRKKTKKIRTTRKEINKVSFFSPNTQLELSKKNCFLKQYKKQTINKANLLNYLLINSINKATSSTCLSSIIQQASIVSPLSFPIGRITERKSSVIQSKDKLGLTLNNNSYTKNKINIFLRYLLLKNFSSKSIVKLPVLPIEEYFLKNKICNLGQTSGACCFASASLKNPTKSLSLLRRDLVKPDDHTLFDHQWVNSQHSINKGENKTAFHSDKIKSSVNFQGKQTQYFLFYNLINFRLLNNNNRFVLTTNLLKTKLYNHQKHLQESILKNNSKFSNVRKMKRSFMKINYWENQQAEPVGLFRKNKLDGKQNSLFKPGGSNEEGRTNRQSLLFLPTEKNSIFSASLHFPTSLQLDKAPIILRNHEAALHFHKAALHFHKEVKVKAKQTEQQAALVSQQAALVSRQAALVSQQAALVSQQAALVSPVAMKLDLLNLLCSQNTNYSSLLLNLINNQFLKKDYIFSSLINNESLKKTHINYNQIFKNFINLTTSNLSAQVLENSYKTNKKKVLLLHNSSYKNHLEAQLSNVFSCNVVVSFSKLSNEKQSAIFLAEEIIFYLEKRVPFFKIKNQILREITKNSFLKGLRITCSGRVGGRSKKAQRSKIQIIKYGQTSLHVFSSKIDFASKHAHTAFGLLGIKVWICYN